MSIYFDSVADTCNIITNDFETIGQGTAGLFSMWFNASSFTDLNYLFRAGSAYGQLKVGGTTELQITYLRATTPDLYDTSDIALETGKWTFLAVYGCGWVVAQNTALLIWKGDFETPPKEYTLTKTQTGSGQINNGFSIFPGHNNINANTSTIGEYSNVMTVQGGAANEGQGLNINPFNHNYSESSLNSLTKPILEKYFLMPIWQGKLFPPHWQGKQGTGTTYRGGPNCVHLSGNTRHGSGTYFGNIRSIQCSNNGGSAQGTWQVSNSGGGSTFSETRGPRVYSQNPHWMEVRR